MQKCIDTYSISAVAEIQGEVKHQVFIV